VFERFTDRAREVVVRSQSEARSLRHNYIGTEHLLLGLLGVTDGAAGRALRELGLDHAKTRERIVEIVGMPPPSEPDPAALDVIGIDLDAVRKRAEEAFGPGALDRTRARAQARAQSGGRRARRWRRRCEQTYLGGHIPFTPRAKKVLELSLREALQLGHRYVGTEHILLGVLREGEGLAALLLTRSGIDLEAARRRLLDDLGGASKSG
jgi:ATP-dependent Clp protease ATP-binding subunit ClpA